MESVTVALLEGLGVDALGINCGLGPVQMKGILAYRNFMKVASVPVIVNPNAGLPRSEGGRTVYDIDADEFAGTDERDRGNGSLCRRGLLRHYSGAYPENHCGTL